MLFLHIQFSGLLIFEEVSGSGVFMSWIINYVCFLIAFLTALLRNTSYRVDEDFLGKRFEDEFFRQCPEVAQGSFDVAQCVQYLRVNVRGFGCETQAPEISALITPLHQGRPSPVCPTPRR